MAQEAPYFAVLTNPKYKVGELDEASRAEFFQSGEQAVDGILRKIRAHVAPEFSPDTALDFGCGVGRLAMPIARQCNSVFGVDASPTMLDIARRNAADTGLENIEFLLTKEFEERRPLVDWVNSIIVFQHIPPSVGYGLVDRLLGCLKDNGCFSLHFNYAKSAWMLSRAAEHADCIVARDDAVELIRFPRDQTDVKMQMYDYDLNTLFLILRRHRISQMHIENAMDEGYYNILICGKKDPVPQIDYDLDAVLDFSDQGNSRPYLIEGFSAAEPWGTWTVGGKALISLALPVQPGADPLLSLTAAPFLHGDHRRLGVDVLVNDTVVAQWEFTDTAVSEHRAIIPVSCIAEDGKLIVQLIIRDPRSPAEMGVSTDDLRKLGLGIRTLRITSMPEAAP